MPARVQHLFRQPPVPVISAPASGLTALKTYKFLTFFLIPKSRSLFQKWLRLHDGMRYLETSGYYTSMTPNKEEAR